LPFHIGIASSDVQGKIVRCGVRVEHNIFDLKGEPDNENQGTQDGKSPSASSGVFFDSVVGQVDGLGVFVSLSEEYNQTVVARDVCHLIIITNC
jgi:hypothetical protein